MQLAAPGRVTIGLMKTILAVLAVVLLAAVLAWRPAGVNFTLVNAGAQPLLGVRVLVTGRDYPIGDLAPGETKRLRLSPTGDSHVELALAGGRRLVIGSYLQPGYRGSLEARVTADAVLTVRNEVEPGVY
jgi:hypothetical protein